MKFDYRIGRDATSRGATAHDELTPGKTTLTEQLAPIQRSALAAEPLARAAPAPPADANHRSARATLQMLFGRPREAIETTEATEVTGMPGGDPAHVHAAATHGTATPASKLPYADHIQRAFGRHDISGIQRVKVPSR